MLFISLWGCVPECGPAQCNTMSPCMELCKCIFVIFPDCITFRPRLRLETYTFAFESMLVTTLNISKKGRVTNDGLMSVSLTLPEICWIKLKFLGTALHQCITFFEQVILILGAVHRCELQSVRVSLYFSLFISLSTSQPNYRLNDQIRIKRESRGLRTISWKHPQSLLTIPSKGEKKVLESCVICSNDGIVVNSESFWSNFLHVHVHLFFQSPAHFTTLTTRTPLSPLEKLLKFLVQTTTLVLV